MAYVTPQTGSVLNKGFDTNVLHGASRLCTGMNIEYIFTINLEYGKYLGTIYLNTFDCGLLQ